MEGFAENALRELAASCTEGSYIFREEAEEVYCTLIVPESGTHVCCPLASEEVVVVRENRSRVSRHRCLAGALIMPEPSGPALSEA